MNAPSQSATRLRTCRLLTCAALLTLPPAAALAQLRNTPGAPPPRPPSLPAVPQQAAAPPAIPTLNVSVRRVVVDVVVTDSAGKPVTGLKQSDFQLQESGQPQQIRSFDVHAETPHPSQPMPPLPPSTYSNFSAGPLTGPPTVILYDLLNTPLDAQPYAHAQLLQFLKTRSAGQAAIFVLTDRLHMLQGFTDDDRALVAALEAAPGQYRSGLLQGPGEATQASDQLTETAGNANGATGDPNVSFQAVSTMLQHMETMETSYLIDRRVEITADALADVARFLASLPGRKNLLWLSGGFPSGILPDGGPNGGTGSRDSFEVTRTYSSEIVAATRQLNLSHVAVYPVDVRGLQTNSMFSAANKPTFEPGQGKDLAAARNFSQRLAADHATMDSIGTDTGGRAFYNTNGLKEAAQAALGDGSLYYTLTYAPTDHTLDGKLRSIRLELAPQLREAGYHLTYRRNYFADLPEKDKPEATPAPGLALPGPSLPNQNDPIEAVMTHGAPPARELFFEAHLQLNGTPAPATPDQMQVLDLYRAHNEAAIAKASRKAVVAPLEPRTPVPMQHYLITYGLLIRQLDLPILPDGNRRGDLRFAVAAFDEDGRELDAIQTRVEDVLTPDRYHHLDVNGYELLQSVDLPAGAMTLRLGVRDAVGNRMGSVEVHLPLPRVQTPPPAAAPAGPGR